MKFRLVLFLFFFALAGICISFVRAQSYGLPSANFIISPYTGEATTNFTFDASDSFNGSGTKGNLEYRWQFRSGRDWTNWSGSPKANFVPLDDGTFRARLEIRDRTTRQTQTTYRTYRALTSFPRRAHIYVSTTRPKAGEAVQFYMDVFKVRNEDIDRIQVRWDFDGDGRFDTNFSRNKEAWWTFGLNQVNSFSPRAEVKYEDGDVLEVRGITPDSGTRGSTYRSPLQATDRPKINVRSAQVVTPILEVQPGSYGPHPETQFIFDATKSKIPRGGWLEWSFDNDAYQKGPTRITKQFEASGKHIVRVRTCLGFQSRECAESQATFEVKAPPVQFYVQAAVNSTSRDIPFTKVSEGVYTTFIGQTVRLLARVQTADSRTVSGLQYRWDFDGDGRYESVFSTKRDITYRFEKPGRYKPTVEVMSDDQIKETASLTIDVDGNTFPSAAIQLSSDVIEEGQEVVITPVVEDRETNKYDLKVRFDANGDGQWDGDFFRLRSVRWRYNEPGRYRIRMQVQDVHGQVRTAQTFLLVYPQGQSGTGGTSGGSVGSGTGGNGSNGSGNSNGSGGNGTGGSTGGSGSGSNGGGFTGGGTTGGNGGFLSPNPGGVGNRELRIPIYAPELEFHKDFKAYLDYVTGRRTTKPEPQHPEPYLGTPGVSGDFTTGGSFAFATGEDGVYEGTIPSGNQGASGQGNQGTSSGAANTSQNFSGGSSTQQNPTAFGAGAGQPLGGQGVSGGSTQNPNGFGSVTSTQRYAQAPAKIQTLLRRYEGVSIEPPYPGENPFTDISGNEWYFDYVIQAYRDGFVSGPTFW